MCSVMQSVNILMLYFSLVCALSHCTSVRSLWAFRRTYRSSHCVESHILFKRKKTSLQSTKQHAGINAHETCSPGSVARTRQAKKNKKQIHCDGETSITLPFIVQGVVRSIAFQMPHRCHAGVPGGSLNLSKVMTDELLLISSRAEHHECLDQRQC